MNQSNPVPQRYMRPFKAPPGFWKQQLATRYLVFGARGDIDALRQLMLEHPEFLNKRGPFNRTLLWEAARGGKLPAVQWLVEGGADLDATGSYNHESLVQLTPYCAAIYYHRANVAEFLRARGTQVDIFRAAFLGDLEKVSRELAAQPDLIHTEDPHDSTYYMPLLAFAVVGGHAEMVSFLLQHGAQTAPYSTQLLGLAVGISRLDLIDLLVKGGADMRAVGAGIFVSTKDVEIHHYLLRHGASPSRRHENGFTPLIYLSRGDKGEHPEKIQILLDYGAPVNDVGPKNRTALHYAAAGGFLRVIALLLDHGADLTLRDEDGNTPFDLALRSGKTAAAALLEDRGAAL